MKPHRRIILSLIFTLAPVSSQAQEAGTESGQSSPFSQAKFVPDISLIVDCSFIHRNLSDDEYDELYTPGAARSHEHPVSQRGFNLNYGEISFYSVVDPYFDLFAVCHLSEQHFHLEEAYWLTRKLPAGLQVKAGKFLSGFGRINEQHTHYWDFAHRPLVHQAVFGEEGLNEIGARLTWVAPLETYLMLGGEILMGANEASFGRTGFQDARGSVHVNSVNGPGLFVGYCRASVDVDEASVLLGLSGGRGNTRVDEGLSAGNIRGTALAGHTEVYGGELTVKYLLDAIRYVSFQSEYLWRSTDATLYADGASQTVQQSPFERSQSGLYVQAVAKLGLRWRAGIRLDLLQRNRITENGVRKNLPENLQCLAGMIEFNPTEFSRIRLQYNYDRSKYTFRDQQESRMTVHELNLQVNLAIGAHGAHSF